MYNIPLAILILSISLLIVIGSFTLSVAFFRRALLSVVETFRKHDAVEEENAITTVELGCKPRTLMNFFNPGLRDYKVEALELLMSCGIVEVTEENRYYLCEERLVAMIPEFQPF
ncbi:MAG: hypothetical protein Q7J85_05815 [Bacillota bacterium]|nr:hypothetical protein [Bacillota bacterium]